MSISQKILDIISLEGKVAMITGGAAGIGFGAAKRLAEAGADIAILDVNESKGMESEAEIKKIGVKAKFYKCDVT